MLIEESGIAKGIRRIVGFTRLNAQAARSRAKDMLARLSELEALPGTTSPMKPKPNYSQP